MSYDQRLETILAISASGIVFCGLWIVWILVKIEATKTVSFAVDDDGDIHNLDLQEEMEDGLEVEVEKPPSPKKSSNPTKQKKHRYRRVSMAFKVQQTVSVLVLILLTYLLLVVSAAPMWLSAIGSFCVFGVFLKYQIGDELRRARLDRLTLMVSLFLMIASLLSLGTYTMKSLKQGEIYEGPARIVGYDVSTYNNSKHDPSTRADLMVQWGKAWACPLSGGKVCQAHVSGAMCSANTVGDRRRRRRRRHLADNLEAENEKLEKQNEELEEEVEELKEKQGNEEEEEELEVEAVEVDENEVKGKIDMGNAVVCSLQSVCFLNKWLYFFYFTQKDEYDEEEKEVEEEEVEEEELDVVDEEYM